jgi:hypothetical protein
MLMLIDVHMPRKSAVLTNGRPHIGDNRDISATSSGGLPETASEKPPQRDLVAMETPQPLASAERLSVPGERPVNTSDWPAASYLSKTA